MNPRDYAPIIALLTGFLLGTFYGALGMVIVRKAISTDCPRSVRCDGGEGMTPPPLDRWIDEIEVQLADRGADE